MFSSTETNNVMLFVFCLLLVSLASVAIGLARKKNELIASMVQLSTITQALSKSNQEAFALLQDYRAANTLKQDFEELKKIIPNPTGKEDFLFSLKDNPVIYHVTAVNNDFGFTQPISNNITVVFNDFAKQVIVHNLLKNKQETLSLTPEQYVALTEIFKAA